MGVGEDSRGSCSMLMRVVEEVYRLDKWEYVIEDYTVPQGTSREELAMHLNERGDEGWELMSLSGLGETPTGAIEYRALFKRPKEPVGFSFA